MFCNNYHTSAQYLAERLINRINFIIDNKKDGGNFQIFSFKFKKEIDPNLNYIITTVQDGMNSENDKYIIKINTEEFKVINIGCFGTSVYYQVDLSLDLSLK